MSVPYTHFQASLLVHDTGVEFMGGTFTSPDQAYKAMQAVAGPSVLTYANPMTVERLFREAEDQLSSKQFGVASPRGDHATLTLRKFCRAEPAGTGLA